MARHGENIRKREDGRWEGRYLLYNEEKGKTSYRSVYSRTYQEVKEKLELEKRQQKEQHSEVQKIPSPALSVPSTATTPTTSMLAVSAEGWLQEVKATKKLSTYVKYHLLYQNYLEHLLCDTDVPITTDFFAKERIPDHLSDSTKKSINCVINQLLKYTSRKYPITIPKLDLPVISLKNKPVSVFTRAEQARLFTCLHDHMDPFKLAILLCLHTGLRLGELCTLQWTDIDFEHKILSVNRTVQRLYIEGQQTKTVLMETEPKSEYSRREIPLSAMILDLMKPFQGNGKYVFGKEKPVEPRTMQNHFKKLLQESQVQDKNFHTLRHTFATNCIEGGMDVKSLSEILGHSDVQITLNRYVHPSMEVKRGHLESLSLFYGQIHGQAS